MRPNFEWDENKAKANRQKHRIGFDEAMTVFADPFSITVPDPDHSESEHRYITVGVSERGRLLVVIHTERRSSIRIISCRKAALAERRFYEEGNA